MTSLASPGIGELELIHWLKEQNHARLERVYDIISQETTESGEPIRVVRIPMPELTLEVFQPGDGTYDYFARYDDWEDGSTLPELMLAVWPASYVNYVPTNKVGWVEGDDIESAGEQCPAVYSPN